ncbi:hypothetical protein BKA81DRAFT_204429 [Phyllosticta paracitricarpa]
MPPIPHQSGKPFCRPILPKPGAKTPSCKDRVFVSDRRIARVESSVVEGSPRCKDRVLARRIVKIESEIVDGSCLSSNTIPAGRSSSLACVVRPLRQMTLSSMLPTTTKARFISATQIQDIGSTEAISRRIRAMRKARAPGEGCKRPRSRREKWIRSPSASSCSTGKTLWRVLEMLRL